MLKLLQLASMVAITVGVTLIYLPAGFIIGGALAFIAGELLHGGDE